MRFPGLNSRQCRALIALRERGKLSTIELGHVIGPYATNTIASLVTKGLAFELGVDAFKISTAGDAIASVIVAQQPRAAAGGA